MQNWKTRLVGMGDGINHQFGFGNVRSKVPLKHPSVGVKWWPEYTDVEFKRELWPREINETPLPEYRVRKEGILTPRTKGLQHSRAGRGRWASKESYTGNHGKKVLRSRVRTLCYPATCLLGIYLGVTFTHVHQEKRWKIHRAVFFRVTKLETANIR